MLPRGGPQTIENPEMKSFCYLRAIQAAFVGVRAFGSGGITAGRCDQTGRTSELFRDVQA
jgi:hypothetical protein